MAGNKSGMVRPELQALTIPINSVELWPNNPRRGDVGMISESLKKHGQIKPIIVQESTKRVIAGNHVLRAAAALGWTEIAAVVIDIDDKQAKSYVAADNRAAELGDFDDEMLARLLQDIARNDTLEGTGYDKDDLDDLLAKVGATGKGGFGNPDATKPVPEDPWVQPGQMFALGPHRVVCADGGDSAALSRLMDGYTPELLLMRPNGVAYASMLDSMDGIDEQFFFDPPGTDLMPEIPEMAGSWLVWDKRIENTSQDHAAAFELIWSRKSHRPEIFHHIFVGAADGESFGGPDFNERPTALYQDIYERFSRFEGVILDPFSLGATALLAADRSGRVYLGAKAEPAHVQALLEKWKEYSGMDFEEI